MMSGDLASVERHGEAFSRALRVPDDPNSLAALLGSGGDGCFDRSVDCVELMVGGNLLRSGTVVILEHNEVSEQVEQPILLEDASNQSFEFETSLRSNFTAFHSSPGHEAFTV